MTFKFKIYFLYAIYVLMIVFTGHNYAEAKNSNTLNFCAGNNMKKCPKSEYCKLNLDCKSKACKSSSLPEGKCIKRSNHYTCFNKLSQIHKTVVKSSSHCQEERKLFDKNHCQNRITIKSKQGSGQVICEIKSPSCVVAQNCNTGFSKNKDRTLCIKDH